MIRTYLTTGLLFFMLTANYCMGQKGMVSDNTLNSVSHATCYGIKGSASIKLLVSYGINPCAVGAFTLYLEKDGVYYSTINSSTLYSTGSINYILSSLAPGEYVVSGSISGYNPNTSTSYGIVALPALTFKVGYQAVWGTLKEMAVQSLPSSVLQNVTTPTQTYSGARSLNEAYGTCWVMATANFSSSSSTSRSVYLSFTNTAALVSFTPSQTGYIEFRKGGTATSTSGEGVYVKFSSAVYKLNGALITDRIRIERTSTLYTGTIKFYINQSLSPLAATLVSSSVVSTPLSITYTGVMSNTAFAAVSGDGLLDVATSNVCTTADDTYANLKYELDGYYHVIKGGKIRFVYNPEYDIQPNLKFTIFNERGLLVKTQANFPAISVSPGDNYVVINVSTDQYCIGPGMFYLEVVNDKKEKFYLRFYNDYTGCGIEAEVPPIRQ